MQILPTSTVTKYMENSEENMCVDIGGLRVKQTNVTRNC